MVCGHIRGLLEIGQGEGEKNEESGKRREGGMGEREEKREGSNGGEDY